MRNVINQEAITTTLKDLSKIYPKLGEWINSKLKNYLLKKAPVKIANPETKPQWFKEGMILHEVILNEEELNNLCRYAVIFPDSVGKNIEDTIIPSQENPIFMIRNDNFYWQELKNSQALNQESRMMHHCVHSYADAVSNGRTRIFSLRNPQGEARCTVEYQSGKIKQVVSEFNMDHRLRDYQAIVDLAAYLDVPYDELKPMVNHPYHLILAATLGVAAGWYYSPFFYAVAGVLVLRYLHTIFSQD